jgi:hypothetical protein
VTNEIRLRYSIGKGFIGHDELYVLGTPGPQNVVSRTMNIPLWKRDDGEFFIFSSAMLDQ